MEFTDAKRLDFVEKWGVSATRQSWFTVLTQTVSKEDCPTLRDFCDYAIRFEMMIDSNGLDILEWHSMPIELQEIVIRVWEDEGRVLTDIEKESLQRESDQYWEDVNNSLR